MNKFVKFSIFITITCLVLGLATIGGIYLYLEPELPEANEIKDIQLQVPLRIYSTDGKLIGEFGNKRRQPIDYKDVPEKQILAFLAAEDDRFYEHIGINFKSLARAIVQRLTKSERQTGASTITMQVAKNYFLTPERTIKRKMREMFLALELEYYFSKDEIMELYVNKIFLGNRAYGIGAAAQVYYGKPCHELTVSQMAMIAGLPKAPSRYNPIVNPERAVERRDWILDRMKDLDFITAAEHKEAKQEPVTASLHEVDIDLDAPYVAELARADIVAQFGETAYIEGYKVYTTINGHLQETAQKAIQAGIHAYDSRHGYKGPENQLPDLSEENKKAFFKEAKTINELQPAVIVELAEKTITAELANQEQIVIEWENGLADLKPHISASRVGDPIQKTDTLFSPGDIIRVRKIDETWHLTQVPEIEAALVSLNPENGAIISLVGGYDFDKSKFNRATQAERQLGSNIKPFIYAAALNHGFTPASTINDAPVVFDDSQLEDIWRPKNDGGRFYGPTRLRRALYKSRNLVSVRIVRKLGLNRTINYISQFGFDKKILPRDLSLALGSPAFTPMNVATGYASFANRGFKIEPYLIDEIRDSDDKVIFKADPFIVCADCEEEVGQDAENAIAKNLLTDSNNESIPTETDTNNIENSTESSITETDIDQVNNNVAGDVLPEPEKPIKKATRIMTKQVAFLIDDILQDVIGPAGTGRRALVLERPDIAGKTGTTNGPTDAWFSGYQPKVVTTVWVGFNNNAVLGRGEYGGSAALPIWIDFMREALKNEPVVEHQPPEGIVSVLIDKETGKRAKPGDSNTMFEYIQEDLLDTIDVPEENNPENQAIENLENIF